MFEKAPSPMAIGRRERRRQRQSKQIMDAAAHLFAEKGYAATTTKDIALAADIGESTLYGYFTSKQEILRAILVALITRVTEYIKKFDRMHSRAEIVDLTDGLIMILLDNSIYLRAFIAEAWVNDQILDEFVVQQFHELMDLIRNTIREGVEVGVFAEIDPMLGARVMVSSFLGVFLPYLRGRDAIPSPEQRHALTEVVVNLVLDGFTSRRPDRNKPGVPK